MRRVIYCFLVWLHPTSFRERFGEEMLSIYDEGAKERSELPFSDALASLIRQWIFHSSLWKPFVGAALTILIVLTFAHGLTSSFKEALRRGTPRHDAEVRTRQLNQERRALGDIFQPVVEAAGTQRSDPRTQSASARTPAVVDGISGIVAAFQHHPVVMIGEDHWLRETTDFYIRLIRDPQFQQSVQDIVIEFASRNNQPLLDRYIGGQEVPVEDVRRIWRDTTKVASWESPVYAELLLAIRETNKTLPSQRQLRVLAGDTAVDWSRVHTQLDWEALGDGSNSFNSYSFAAVIAEEVLAKKHHALVVLGANHVLKAGDRDLNPNASTRVESQQPGATYVALLICHGPVADAAQEVLQIPNLTPPALVDLALFPSRKPMKYGAHGVPLRKEADALLYLGPPESLTMIFPPARSLEPAYMQEVDRRSMIEWGELRARKFLGVAAR